VIKTVVRQRAGTGAREGPAIKTGAVHTRPARARLILRRVFFFRPRCRAEREKAGAFFTQHFFFSSQPDEVEREIEATDAVYPAIRQQLARFCATPCQRFGGNMPAKGKESVFIAVRGEYEARCKTSRSHTASSDRDHVPPTQG